LRTHARAVCCDGAALAAGDASDDDASLRPRQTARDRGAKPIVRLARRTPMSVAFGTSGMWRGSGRMAAGELTIPRTVRAQSGQRSRRAQRRVPTNSCLRSSVGGHVLPQGCCPASRTLVARSGRARARPRVPPWRRFTWEPGHAFRRICVVTMTRAAGGDHVRAGGRYFTSVGSRLQINRTPPDTQAALLERWKSRGM